MTKLLLVEADCESKGKPRVIVASFMMTFYFQFVFTVACGGFLKNVVVVG